MNKIDVGAPRADRSRHARCKTSAAGGNTMRNVLTALALSSLFAAAPAFAGRTHVARKAASGAKAVTEGDKAEAPKTDEAKKPPVKKSTKKSTKKAEEKKADAPAEAPAK
jgi:hypothetical protein